MYHCLGIREQESGWTSKKSISFPQKEYIFPSKRVYLSCKKIYSFCTKECIFSINPLSPPSPPRKSTGSAWMQHLRRAAARVPAPAAVILPAAATTTPTPSKPPLGHPADRNENQCPRTVPPYGEPFFCVWDIEIKKQSATMQNKPTACLPASSAKSVHWPSLNTSIT